MSVTIVERGARIGTVAWEAQRLDRLMPGWHTRVEVETLNLSSCFDCILGQVQDGFFKGWEIVSFDIRSSKDESYRREIIELYCFPRYGPMWVEEITRRL